MVFLNSESSNDAEAAIKGENGRDHQGKQIIVEWARSSRRGPASGSNSFRRGGGSGGRDLTCFNCGRTGHISRNCRDPRQGSGSYNGGGDRDRDRNRSDHRNGGDRDRRYERKRSRSRSRDGGGSRDKSYSRDRSYSPRHKSR